MGIQGREEEGYPDGGGVDVGRRTDGGRGIEARRYNMARRRQKRLGLTTDEQRADADGRKRRTAATETVLEDDDV